MVGRDIGGIDAERLDGVDGLQHALDLRPAVDLQQDVAAGSDEGQRLERFAGTNGAQDVDARDDGAEVVRRPADEGEDVARREADDAAVAVEDLLGGDAAEAYPAFDPLLDPGQIDVSDASSAVTVIMMPLRSLGDGVLRHLAQHVGDGDAALEGIELDAAVHLTCGAHAPATCHTSVVWPPPPFQLRSADHRLLLLLFPRRSTSQLS